LFELPYEKIEVVIHPQSIVHSFVEFVDGSILAQMGEPDMRLPILYALSYPDRSRSHVRSSIKDFPELTFDEADPEKYPGLKLALAAAKAGGNAPTVLNAANEVAVAAFLAGQVVFPRIYEIIEDALGAINSNAINSLEDILETDRATRDWIAKKYTIKTTKVN
jgi:1-deoxy-D-xylulose-5-phosphate reductoisomerase